MVTDWHGGVGATSCDDTGRLVCRQVEVPLEHSKASGLSLWISDAVAEPDSEISETLVIAIGGPGIAGTAVAQSLLATLPPQLIEQFRIVFFDYRGTGASAIDCRTATAAFEHAVRSLDPPYSTPEAEASAADYWK
ncbi:MAG: hypothetical protein M3451_01600, partial [Chloroflexota bacterium]|nr:hypothetical protein [Chloroflexota bacterium]